MPRDRAPWTLAASVPQTDIDYGAWSSRRGDPQQRGGRWADYWTVINGIFFRPRAGCPWRDLPEGFGY
jgi:transposase